MRPRWPVKHVSHDTHATFHSGTLFDRDLTLTFAFSQKANTYLLSCRPLRRFTAKFGFVAVIILVSASDKA